MKEESVAALLWQLNLERHHQVFEAEEVDMEKLMGTREADLRSISLPFGARNRISEFLASKSFEADKTNESSLVSFELELGLIQTHMIQNQCCGLKCAIGINPDYTLRTMAEERKEKEEMRVQCMSAV